MPIPVARVVADRRRLLPPGWPVYALFGLFPIWWILGLGGLIWPVLATPMLIWLVRQRTVIAPKGFTIWLLFVLWSLVTSTQVDSLDRWIGFGWRTSLYVSATITLLFVFNLANDSPVTQRMLGALALFWVYVVIGGYLGLAFPNTSFTSPVEMLLPGSLTSNSFVYLLVHPSFAHVQDIFGYPSPRPTAPFVYANDWGANFGILVPLVIVAFARIRRSSVKVGLAIAIMASAIPAIDRRIADCG